MTSPFLHCLNVGWLPRYPPCCSTVWVILLEGSFLPNSLWYPIFAFLWIYLSWMGIIKIWQATLQDPGKTLRLRGTRLNWCSSEWSSSHCQPSLIKRKRLVLNCAHGLWGFRDQLSGCKTSCHSANKDTFILLTAIVLWVTGPRVFNCK